MSDPAFDGYHCHGAMVPILHAENGPRGYVCVTCGVTRNMVPSHAQEQRAEVDRILYDVARSVTSAAGGR